jgi:hypothetical protein
MTRLFVGELQVAAEAVVVVCAQFLMPRSRADSPFPGEYQRQDGKK